LRCSQIKNLGDPAEAYKVLQDFDKRHPGYVAISMRKLNIERRRFSRDKSPDYSSITGKLEKLVHEPGNSRRVSSFYAMKLARFHSKVGHDRRSAERVLKDAIARDKVSIRK
jgi:hypothetical protein